MTFPLLALLFCPVRPAAAALKPRQPYGILLLAHGGAPEWNKEIQTIRDLLDKKVPVEIALGMADPEEIQGALSRLEARGAGKVVAVPLFVNSASEVLDQTRYVLGLRGNPSEVMRLAAAAHGKAHAAHGHALFSLKKAKSSLPLVLTPALDDDPLVVDILLERAKRLSRDPARETLVLAGHGPVDEEANAAWVRTMSSIAQTLKARAGFKAVKGATLRDDAPRAVRDAAVAALRKTVRDGALSGRAIVLPYLIAQGGIEKKISAALKGLPYAWDAKTICPHPHIARWVAASAAFGARKEDMRRFK